MVIDVYYAGYEQTTSFDGHTHLVTDALSFPEKLACVTDVVPQQKQAAFLFESVLIIQDGRTSPKLIFMEIPIEEGLMAPRHGMAAYLLTVLDR